MSRTLTDQAREVLTLLGQASEPVTKEDRAFQQAVTDFCHAVIEADSHPRETQLYPHSG
jgi:hypothetical protein